MDFLRRRKISSLNRQLSDNKARQLSDNKARQLSNNKKTKKLELSNKKHNISICKEIESKHFPINSSLKIQFIFDKLLQETQNSIIINLKDIQGKSYILLSSDLKRMYLMMLFICKYKIKPGFVRYSISNNLNPFSNTKASNNFYYIIFKSDKFQLLKNAILRKHINLYDFKKALNQFLKSYSTLNKKYGFIYNNISSDSLVVNKLNKQKHIIMFDYTYSYDSITKNTHTKKYNKEYYEMKKMYQLNDISEKSEGNYDIICIIFLINICNSYLNEIPKELTLDQDDIKFFNNNYHLYDKLNHLLKKDLLKIL